jgi:regulation of enolase protein 1 (concanavalin A-like superfamily)
VLSSATWVKLVRAGNTFAGYISFDGDNWMLVSSTTVDMTGTILIGLAVSAHSSSAAETAVFSNVSIV